MFVLLAGAAGWSANWMAAQRAVARSAARDLAECKRLAEQIRELRRKPNVASSEALGDQELGKRIAEASRQARFDSVPADVLHPAPRRVGDSPYLRKPTVLRLDKVALPQLVVFLYQVTEESSLNVRSLKLTAPRGEANARVWDARVTLTYLIYEPASST
jgi:hypothetical protein